jgi:hypothetical protein
METGDPTALRDAETQVRVETAQAIAGLGIHPVPPDASSGAQGGRTN